MRRFQFRLETLLKFRHIQKDEAQVKFGQAVKLWNEAGEQLKRLESEWNNQVAAFHQKQTQILSIDTLKMFNYFFDKIEKDIMVQKHQVAAADKRRLQCLHELEEAMRNLDVVEKLRKKRLQQHQSEQLQEEQKLLDEIGLQLYVRKY